MLLKNNVIVFEDRGIVKCVNHTAKRENASYYITSKILRFFSV